jgi:hypothetical protein
VYSQVRTIPDDLNSIAKKLRIETEAYARFFTDVVDVVPDITGNVVTASGNNANSRNNTTGQTGHQHQILLALLSQGHRQQLAIEFERISLYSARTRALNTGIRRV